ncbi:MAG TPA: class I SAM-dependent methyltransferase, partial [Phenylobacterium sp.]|nr:class I SAM-dependent methyltransferase [Phenylobacterium sp.]
LVRDLYDDQFVRMWEFYLASSEMSFRYGSLMVLQVQLASQVGSLSITRDYMVDTERASLAPATTKRAARR